MQVIGLYNPVYDFIMRVDDMPPVDGNASLLEYSFQGGGKVSTGLIAAARLGAETAIVGAVGSDAFGKLTIDDFKHHGVDVSHLMIDEEKGTNFCVCISQEGREGRRLIGKKAGTKLLTSDELDRSFIESAEILHVAAMEEVHQKAAQWVKEKGGRVLIDADGYTDAIHQNLQYIDIFIGSEFYYKHVFGESKEYEKNFKQMQAMGPDIVIFTFGSEGCKGVYQDTYFEQTSFKVKVKDTTGAGDVFHGAFAAFTVMGYDVERAAKYSSAVSAIKCTRIGGRTGIPSLKMVQDFVEKGTYDDSELDERVEYYANKQFK